jgi:TolB protein
MTHRHQQAELGLLVLCFFGSSTLSAQEDVYLRLSTQGRRQVKVVVSEFKGSPRTPEVLKPKAAEIRQILEDDLRFSLYLDVLYTPLEARDFSTDRKKVNYPAWGSLGAQILVAGDLRIAESKKAPPRLTGIEVRIYDLVYWKEIYSRAYTTGGDLRATVHAMSDDIIKALTGEQGVSQSKIAFCRKAGREKEIWLIDYDGVNPRPMTVLRSLSLMPAWSPNGQQIAYVSFSGHNPNLYVFDLAQGGSRLLSGRRGLNIAPAWSPDGRRIALTQTLEGNSEIYTMDAGGGGAQRLTESRAIDTSPSYSPSGREIAFCSDRSGSPQIYVMGVDGTNVRRLTSAGSYNTAPAWSPRGDRIAYVSREASGRFQVCTIEVLGGAVWRLTDQGDNEDPCWSSDGLHLAFCSNRTGTYELYTMNFDGSDQKRITSLGGATGPTWSP